jgi:iron complex transport system substrate-binding protein
VKTVLFILIVLLLSVVSPAIAQTEPCAADFRLIEHALGESCIPERPQHVVPLDIAIAEVMVILGERPAVKSQAALDFIIARMHPEVLEDFESLYGDVPDVGFPINLEVIVEVNPDLIVAPAGFMTDSLYEQLTQIAPTVVFDLEPGDWRGRVLFAGEALNRQDEVDDLLAVVDERATELQAALGDTMQETEVSLVRVFTNQIGILIAGSTGDRVLRELGFARPQAQAEYDLAFVLDDNNGRAELPLQREEIRLADGDVIFVFGQPEVLRDDPLWSRLSAVQAGQVYEVGYYWYGDGLLSVHDMLDDLLTHLVGRASEVVNPYREGLP